MKVSGQMLTILRAIGELAACSEEGVSYTQITKATGITQQLLMSKTFRLKARGLIERANPGAPRCDHAFFIVTASGRAALNPETAEPEVSVTSMQRAIQRRHALATCWSPA
jgi:DNA-binding MarR family transcriptional regulator